MLSPGSGYMALPGVFATNISIVGSMRAAILVIVLLLIKCLPLKAQQSCADSSTHTRYLLADSAIINRQIVLADGGKLLLGYIKTHSSTVVVRLDADGSVKWRKKITMNQLLGSLQAIAEATNGNIILTGTVSNRENSPFVIMMLSPDGNIINQQQVGFENTNITSGSSYRSEIIAKPNRDSLIFFFVTDGSKGNMDCEYLNLVTTDNAGNIGSAYTIACLGIASPHLLKYDIQGDSLAMYGVMEIPGGGNIYSSDVQLWGYFMMKINLKTRELGTKRTYGLSFSGKELWFDHDYQLSYANNNTAWYADNFFPQKNGNLIAVSTNFLREQYASDTLLRLFRISTFDDKLNFLHSEFLATTQFFSPNTTVEAWVDDVGNKRFSFYDFDKQTLYYALVDPANNFSVEKQLPFPSANKYVSAIPNDITEPGYLASFNVISLQGKDVAMDLFKILPSDSSSQCFGSNTSLFTTIKPASLKPIPWSPQLTPQQVVPYVNQLNYTTEDYVVTPMIICTVKHLCDTLKIHAPETWCDSEKPLTITAYKNPSCAARVLFSFDTASASSYKQIDDTTLNLAFNKQWQGKVYATLSTCPSQKDSVNVLYAPHSRLDIGKDTLFCPYHTYTLYAGAGFENYVWQDNSTHSVFTADKPGMYYISTTDYCGNSFADTIRISDSKLVLNAGTDTVICKGETILLAATKGFENYAWAPVHYLSNAVAAVVEASPVTTTIYSVSADVFNGCTVTSTVMITVSDCPQHFFMPNAFTPNGDGVNDVFKPSITGVVKNYELSVYNRFGERVFSCTNQNRGWDGFYKNTIQPEGGYIWVCKYQFFNQPTEIKKGTLLLVK